MQSDAFNHAFQSTTFTVAEFEEGSDCFDMYLQALASRLNSNEAFEADDSFTVETTFICTPAPGGGNGKRYKPSSVAVRGIVKCSHVTIKNRDELCCARAIVTTKALVDANGNTGDHHYKNLKQGYLVQKREAQELHRLAGVPGGPCGISELPIFVGPTPSDKIIRIIKEDNHYDGCNSFSGFLSKSYFCDECNRGYDHEDRENHPCDGKWCPSCHRKDCPVFTEAKRPLGPGKFPSPSSPCHLCHRSFLVRTVTLTIFIVAVKTFHPFASPTKNVPTALRPTKWRMLVTLELDLNNTSTVGANAPFVNNKCTSLLTNVTSSAFQKRRMIPK